MGKLKLKFEIIVSNFSTVTLIKSGADAYTLPTIWNILVIVANFSVWWSKADDS